MLLDWQSFNESATAAATNGSGSGISSWQQVARMRSEACELKIERETYLARGRERERNCDSR